MPSHDTLGSYEIEGNFYLNFEPAFIDGMEIERSIQSDPKHISPALLEQYSSFCLDLERHIQAARHQIAARHNELVKPFLKDLIEANEDEDLLSILFTDANLQSIDALTPEMVERVTRPAKCWAAATGGQLDEATIDLRFSDPDMNYLFACKFSIDGTLRTVEIES